MKDPQTSSLRMLLKVVESGAAPSPHAIPLYVAALSFAIHQLEHPDPKRAMQRAYSRGYQAGIRAGQRIKQEAPCSPPSGF